jgi:hypothetical protein
LELYDKIDVNFELPKEEKSELELTIEGGKEVSF